MNTKMTFHESYGHLPVTTLRLVRKYNVSPADLDFMLDQFSENNWNVVNDHIVDNSASGMYTPRFF